MILEPNPQCKKRDMITVFLEDGLFLESKIYTIGVENKESKVDLIYFTIHINKGSPQADPELRGPIKQQDLYVG